MLRILKISLGAIKMDTDEYPAFGASDVAEAVMKTISEQMSIPVEKIKPEHHIVDDLGADALHLIELVMSMEEIFDLEIDDEEFERAATVQDVINFILDSKHD